jgi:hypothetical protein
MYKVIRKPSGLIFAIGVFVMPCFSQSFLCAQIQPSMNPCEIPLELQQARGWFASNQAPRALATLAAALRKEPTAQLVAKELLAALNQRNFPRLLEVSNSTVQSIVRPKPPWKSLDGMRELQLLTNGTGQLYDAGTGKSVGAPLQHSSGITSAYFSPDSQRVATLCQRDGTTRIWDTTTGHPLSPLLKHRSQINSAQFSPNGRLLVTGSCDNTAQVWDGFTGALVSEPMWVGYIVSLTEWSSDSQRVMVTLYDQGRKVYVFDVQPGRWGERLKSVNHRFDGKPKAEYVWLADLAEAIGGLRLNEGRTQTIPWEERLKVQKHMVTIEEQSKEIP